MLQALPQYAKSTNKLTIDHQNLELFACIYNTCMIHLHAPVHYMSFPYKIILVF